MAERVDLSNAQAEALIKDLLHFSSAMTRQVHLLTDMLDTATIDGKSFQERLRNQSPDLHDELRALLSAWHQGGAGLIAMHQLRLAEIHDHPTTTPPETIN